MRAAAAVSAVALVLAAAFPLAAQVRYKDDEALASATRETGRVIREAPEGTR